MSRYADRVPVSCLQCHSEFAKGLLGLERHQRICGGSVELEFFRIYLRNKKKGLKYKKNNHIQVLLTPQDLLEMSQEAGITIEEDIDIPFSSKRFVLGRVDHDKDYTRDNTDWISCAENTAEVHTRHDVQAATRGVKRGPLKKPAVFSDEERARRSQRRSLRNKTNPPRLGTGAQ
jgi:hypothetical protein